MFVKAPPQTLFARPVGRRLFGASQLRKGMRPAGWVAALRMAEESEEIISEYTDAQAREDGVLVEVSCGAVNRVTRAVFDHFARPMGIEPASGLMQYDFTPVTAAIQAVLGVTPAADGWRISTYGGKELWLVPNEVQGFTLMFPDDY